MVGYGLVAELPDAGYVVPRGVMVFHGNPSIGPEPDGRGVWAELRHGHGNGFTSNGVRNSISDRFGPELGFAAELRRRHPTENIAIIKYARGGTSLAPLKVATSWATTEGIGQLAHARATISHALADRDVDDDGAVDTLVPAGIAWMQGESDAHATEEIAYQYEGHLRATIAALRDALGRRDLPVVIVQISDSGRDAADGKVWDHAAIVQRAQAAFVEHDPRASLVVTQHLGYSDPMHYDTRSYLVLGADLAAAMERLQD